MSFYDMSLTAGLSHNNTVMLSRCFILGDRLELHRKEGSEMSLGF